MDVVITIVTIQQEKGVVEVYVPGRTVSVYTTKQPESYTTHKRALDEAMKAAGYEFELVGGHFRPDDHRFDWRVLV